jgi:proline iminopeptidase
MNVAPVVAWKIHHAIPSSGFVVFERSSHMPFYEEPDRFRQVVEEFLTAK